MEIRAAELSDMDGVLALHARYQVDSIRDEDRKDGFVTTNFSKEQLTELIRHEEGLFVATKDNEVVAYAMAASWQFWSPYPVQAHMIGLLPDYEFNGTALSIENSYQYGPICIDRSARGSGVLERIFAHALDAMARRYPVLVTFINKNNPRSLAAHTHKLGLRVLGEFQFNGNTYYWLACPTARA